MNTKQKKKLLLIGITTLIILIPIPLFTIFKLREAPQKISQVPGLACPVDAGKCEWDAVNGATSYDYKVIDLSTNTQLKAGNTTSTSVMFQPEVGKSYKCEVTAKNNCGSGNTGSGTGSCSSPTTPTPTETPPPPIDTPTPTLTTPKTCNGACQVNANCVNGLICYQGFCRLSSFPTSPTCQIPTPTPSPTLVPTATPIPTATPTVVPTTVNNPPPPIVNNPPPVAVIQPTATPVVVPVIPTTAPQQPSIPPSGSVGATLGIVAGVIITLIGGAVLLLL